MCCCLCFTCTLVAICLLALPAAVKRCNTAKPAVELNVEHIKGELRVFVGLVRLDRRALVGCVSIVCTVRVVASTTLVN